MEHGCEECDSFYVPTGNGVGCSFSWLKLLLLLAMVVALLGTCSYCLAMDDIEPRRAPPRRPVDSAEVLRRSTSHNDDDADLRRRGKSSGRRPEASPPREASSPSYHPGAYPLLQGYSGIESVASYGAK